MISFQGFIKRLRVVAGRLGVCAILITPGVGVARDRTPAAVQDWLSAVITKIAKVDGDKAGASQRKAFGTVTIRIQIAADGFVNWVVVEQSSGSPNLDARARSLVRAASPFSPPPVSLLTKAGTTELSFPLQLRR